MLGILTDELKAGSTISIVKRIRKRKQRKILQETCFVDFSYLFEHD